jgi:hypothetical protein
MNERTDVPTGHGKAAEYRTQDDEHSDNHKHDSTPQQEMIPLVLSGRKVGLIEQFSEHWIVIELSHADRFDYSGVVV